MTKELSAAQSEQGIEEYDFRVCDECQDEMYVGYVVEDGAFYFCSDKCLHNNYTPEQYEEMYEDDDAYWTDEFSGWSPNVGNR